ncbi:YbhB/YbcL family Raf kinase inhibitor-like protein [Acidithiobacillus montserratensis]|uniref:YbhB/YbcL family Raf kinase inhibitor-like protein n=1 Tax=Acidithiobacillus montserratensis TaxID=2729135 RepID=A0ACD5HEQ2_9PROT|nr:YbhB/YbcL family Raf kinase inhibitor-like protein [Acidithiobacillus montserratensis]MBU2748550.1 YbhB/YbcL family Raf kinase inhibitor-like protein [Acidithiobacillus montserratensis]
MAIPMRVFSTGIDPDDWIPRRFTQQGDGATPPIFWQHVPEGTKSLILLMEHREADSEHRIHWLLYDIPPSIEGIHEGGPLPEGILSGRNSFGFTGYKPPEGAASHQLQHYDFLLMATDKASLGLPEGADWEMVKAKLRTPGRKADQLDIPPATDRRAREFYNLWHILDHAEFSGHFALDRDEPVKSSP